MTQDSSDEAGTGATDDSATLKLDIYDATNSMKELQQFIQDKISGIGSKMIFIESISTDSTLLEETIRTVKICTPDYKSMDSQIAISDFHQRRAN